MSGKRKMSIFILFLLFPTHFFPFHVTANGRGDYKREVCAFSPPPFSLFRPASDTITQVGRTRTDEAASQ